MFDECSVLNASDEFVRGMDCLHAYWCSNVHQ